MASPEIVKVSVVFGIDKPATNSHSRYFYGTSRIGSSKIYHYRAPTALGIKDGDLVVVSSPTHGMTVVTVKGEPEPIDHNFTYAREWIVDKVDTETVKTLREREARILKINAELHKMLATKKDQLRFEELLGDDPAAKALMEELKQLQA
jgi:hypothetical protein